MSQVKRELTESKFNMWRACVALIAIDGHLAKEEKLWLTKRASFVPFSKEQIEILEKELKEPVDIEKIIPLITEKKDKAFLLHQIRVLGNIDGSYDVKEREAFKHVEEIVMKGLDIDGITKEIESIEKESYHEENIYKSSKDSTFLEQMVNGFLKMVNPGDYKFPDE